MQNNLSIPKCLMRIEKNSDIDTIIRSERKLYLL